MEGQETGLRGALGTLSREEGRYEGDSIAVEEREGHYRTPQREGLF